MSKQMIGEKFCRLTVISRAENKKSKRFWNCLCKCGSKSVICGGSLLSGNTKSCGCLREELVGTYLKTHGGSKRREYAIWLSMRDRCQNDKNKSYKNYGGRGIRVCGRWANSFDNFFTDMGPAPENLTLDRIDNDSNYEPGNCKWSTRAEQARNRRLRISNKSGVSGVYQKHDSCKWISTIGVGGKTVQLGYFDHIEDAIDARKKAEVLLW